MASFIDFSLEKHCFKLLEGILVTSKEDTTPPPLAYIIEIFLKSQTRRKFLERRGMEKKKKGPM